MNGNISIYKIYEVKFVTYLALILNQICLVQEVGSYICIEVCLSNYSKNNTPFLHIILDPNNKIYDSIYERKRIQKTQKNNNNKNKKKKKRYER